MIDTNDSTPEHLAALAEAELDAARLIASATAWAAGVTLADIDKPLTGPIGKGGLRYALTIIREDACLAMSEAGYAQRIIARVMGYKNTSGAHYAIERARGRRIDGGVA